MSVSLSRRQALTGLAGVAVAPAVIGGTVIPAQAAAPMMGASRPTFNRVKIGDFEVTTLLDGTATRDGPHPIFGADQSPDDVAALMRDNLLPESKVTFFFTPTVVNTGDELVLFDTGNNPGGQPAVGNTAGQLQAAGYAPDQVDIVVITHFHPDHIGGLMTDGAPTYPNARYVTGSAEHDFWSKVAEDDPENRIAKLYLSNVKPVLEKTTFLEPDSEVVGGIRAVDAFGHTPGHMGYLIDSNGAQILLWADTANHFVASVQRPDWHVAFDMDKDKAAATRKRIMDMAAADRIPVIAYHAPFPGIGLIEAKDGGYRWVPESYQIDAMNAG